MDFLCDVEEVQGPSPAAQLEDVRPLLLDWASAALVQRRPDLRAYRGKKGLRTARLDLDLHVKHVHAALQGGAAQDAAAYQRWCTASMTQRGLNAAAIDAGVTILAEALWRFLPPQAGREAIARLAASFPAAKVASGPGSGYSNALVRPRPLEDFPQ